MADRIGEKLTPWSIGEMDLHHINTSRGNCTYCILPDGTTILIDSGQLEVEPSVDSIARRTAVIPDDSRTPWEWATRYIQNVTQHRDPKFDYVWLTHFHSDHLGHVTESSPVLAKGAYRLSGLTGVCDQIPFSMIMDRAWPDYDFPLSAADCRLPDRSHGREGFANSQLAEENYLAFLDWHSRARGVSVERFVPGRSDQARLKRNADGHVGFRFQNIVCNGEVWIGEES